WFAVGKVRRHFKFAAAFFVALFGVKGSLQLQRSFLRATQRNRSSRFAPCAKHSHSSGVAFAVAKATQLLSIAGVAAITRASSTQRPAAAAGQTKPGGFVFRCCWRYVKG